MIFIFSVNFDLLRHDFHDHYDCLLIPRATYQ